MFVLFLKWQKRHEFKTAHGFRKFFKTQAEQSMKAANVEMLMGHDLGISKSYYKPQEKEVMEDYLKAVKNLIIHKNDNAILEKEIDDLREKNENNEHVIKSKLQEKDDALITLSDQVMRLMKEVQDIKSTQNPIKYALEKCNFHIQKLNCQYRPTVN